jgi:hypothetical protein
MWLFPPQNRKGGAMSFLEFWGSALRQSFGVGWVVFGIVSTFMPAVIVLTQKYYAYAASLPWVQKIAENQVEFQTGFAALAVVVYCVYAPFKLYKKRDAEIAREKQENKSLAEQVENLFSEKKRLQENNQLAALLKRQLDGTQKGSLSNRATLLAADIQKLVHDYLRQSALSLSPLVRKQELTKEEARAEWGEQTLRLISQSQDLSETFMRRDAPRLLTIAEEFRANGLTDEQLEKWLKHPGANPVKLERIALSLSHLAIKMEEIERVKPLS